MKKNFKRLDLHDLTQTPQFSLSEMAAASQLASDIENQEPKQVVIKVGTKEGEFDELIAPVIEQLWLSWIDASGWQEIEDTVTLHFHNSNELEKFLNIISDATDASDLDSLYSRISGFESYDPDGKDEEPNWETMWLYDTHVTDFGNENFSSFHCCFAIQFPQSDINEVVARMKEFNAGEEYAG